MAQGSLPGFPIVGIGASAGGIAALKQFFAQVPPDSGLAYVVIVHLSKEHESVLDEILQGATSMPVRQVTKKVKVEPNHVYVIPPGRHLAMEDGHIKLMEAKRVDGHRLPIDLFFRTLADNYGKNAFAVILSGAGSDGTLGLQRVKESGGFVLAQDPRDAEFDSMPRSAIGTGLVDVVLPAEAIPAKILAIYRLEEKLKEQPGLEIERAVGADENAELLRQVLTLLRARTGHDFSDYKRPTLLRRLARRLQVNETETVAAYLDLLRESPEEVQHLMRDLLITVTNFFRDPETFQYLQSEILPKLFANKSGADAVRVWSCGCATGEEAYSLAILLHEHAATLHDPPSIQVFASDINEDSVRFARDCSYPELISLDVSPERLQRFFTRKGELYCVNKELRESVLFAPHNVLRDPPFSQLDMISCRNLLIYLNRDTQERVMEIFNFALRPGGYLLLGSSEAAEGYPLLFAPVDKKHRVYRSLRSGHRFPSLLPQLRRWEIKLPEIRTGVAEQSFSFSAIHHMAAEHYAPPSVLVNEEYDIVHMSERAGRFFHFSGGEPTRNVLKTVLPSLELDLRAALMTAKQDNRQAEFRNVRITSDDGDRQINVIARPVELPDSQARYFLVVFDDERASAPEEGTKAVFAALGGDAALESIVHRLEEELQQTRERLRSTVEQGETSNEELKASNEELQAINEELRSATEELETSKEELQSVNEELTTVNQELKTKMEEVIQVNADLYNLMHSTDIGTIFLDRNLCIKRYTRRVEDLFNIIASDLGRPLEHLTHKLDYDELTKDAAGVLKHLRTVEREVHKLSADEYYLARISPYRTADDRIDGVVISFVDITSLKRTTNSLRERELLLRMAQQAAKAGIWLLNLRDGTAIWSDECFRLRGTEPGSMEMTTDNWIRRFHPEDSDQVRKALDRSVTEHKEYNFETKVSLPSGDLRWLIEVGQAIYDQEGKPERIAGITLDVTEHAALRQQLADQLAKGREDHDQLQLADRRKNEFLASLAHELRNPLAPICNGLEAMRHAPDPQKWESARAMIERQVGQIIHLVDDLLDVSRITQGKIRLRKTRMKLADAVNSALESSRALMGQYEHQLSVTLPEEPVYLEADLTRISQVILNLLNNAAKYTKPGGQIALSAEREGDQVAIRVKDTGIGIASEMLPHIFDIFAQVNQLSGHPQTGLGIGLSIVKNLVEMHGGTVEVQSEGLHLGSEFIVRLPMAEKPPEDDSNRPAEAPTSRSARILVVDDNVDAGDMLKVVLTKLKHTVKLARNGRSGIDTAMEYRPEVVLLDIGLPDIDGFEVARTLRRHMPKIKLVAVSGWGQQEDRKRSKEAGFDYHLVKPTTIDQIQIVLSQALAKPT